LFHKSNLFGSCIIHILYTGCAKIKKNNSGAKRLTLALDRMSGFCACATTFQLASTTAQSAVSDYPFPLLVLSQDSLQYEFLSLAHDIPCHIFFTVAFTTNAFADRLTASIHKRYMNVTINVQFKMLSFMPDVDVTANIRSSCAHLLTFATFSKFQSTFLKQEISWFQYVC